MKKEALVSLAVALTLMSQSALAEIGTITTENWETGKYRIQGHFNKGGKAAVEVLKPSKTVNDEDAYSYVGETNVNDDGSFDTTVFLKGESGEYLVRIGLGGQVFEKKITFFSKDEYDVYKNMIINAKTGDDVRVVFEMNYGKLKTLCNLNVSLNEKERVYSTIFEATRNADIETPEKLKTIIAEVVLLESFMGDTERGQDSLAALFDSFDEKYSPAIELYKNNTLCGDDQKNEIVKKLQSQKIVSLSQLEEKFADTCIFVCLKTAESKGKEIQILDITHTLIPELTEYDYFKSNYTQNTQISILSDMPGGFSSISDYASKFNKAVSDKRGKPSRAESTGKNNSTTYVKVDSSQPQQTLPGENVKNGFSDIENYAWAKTSIMNLYNKKIIQGKADGIFAPADNVKREEFASMVMKALNLYNDSAQCDKFADVKETDWFYKAVASAFEREIINGMSETEFGSGRKITRQDAVVICKKAAEAMGIAFSNDKSEEKTNVSYEYSNVQKDVFSDVDDIADYAKDSVEVLAAAGVINGMADGTFAPAENMTRAQAAVMIERLMGFVTEVKAENSDKDLEIVEMLKKFGMYDGDTTKLHNDLTRKEAAMLTAKIMNIKGISEGEYTDCTQDEYKPYINAVSGMKLITGENNKFRPDENIDYNTAVSIVVKALGYNVSALSDGGFPSGYLRVASSKGLLRGVDKSGEMGITKLNFLKLFVNALDEDVLGLDYSGTDIKFTGDKGNTFLNVYGKIYKEKGQVSANHDIAIGGADKTGSNEITIGSHTMQNTNADYDKLMGHQVTFYYRENGGEEELVYAVSNRKTETLTLNVKDISKFSDMEYTYQSENSIRDKTIKISNAVNVVYNGQSIYDYGKDQLLPKSGTIEFIDSNGDENYDKADVLIITEYKNIVVGGKDITREIIFDKYREDYQIDLTKFDQYTIEDSDGKTYGLREIREWDVISAVISPDGKTAHMYLSDKFASGRCTSIDKDENIITLDDKEFDITSDFGGDYSEFGTGRNVMLYLDRTGSVAAVKVLTETENAALQGTTDGQPIIVILAKYGKDDEDVEESYYIKTYGSDKKMTRRTLEEKISFNGKRVKSSDIAGYMDEALNDAIMIGLTDEGKIKSITTAAGPGEDDTRGFYRLNNKGERLSYGSEASHFGNKFRKGSNVYTVPQDSENIGNLEYYAYNAASFVNDTFYVLDGYTTNKDSRVASVIVYKAKAEKAGSYDPITGFVIASIEDRLDADDEVYQYIEGMNYYEKSDYGSLKGFEVDKEVMIIDATGKEKTINENGEKRKMTIYDLEPGDCIRYTLNNGKLVSIQLTYDYSEDLMDSAGSGAAGSYYNEVINKAAHTYGGYAYQITDNGSGLVLAMDTSSPNIEAVRPENLDLKIQADADKLKYYWIRTSMVTVVDKTKRKTVVRKGTMDDIMTYMQTKSASGYSKVLMFSEWGSSIYGLVVYIE